MKLIPIILMSLLLWLQYPLWLGQGGWFTVHHLRQQLIEQQQQNTLDLQRNIHLSAEVQDLKTGLYAIEGKARYDMGMIKNNEVFVQFVLPGPVKPVDKNVTASAMTKLRHSVQQPMRVVPEPVQNR